MPNDITPDQYKSTLHHLMNKFQQNFTFVRKGENICSFLKILVVTHFAKVGHKFSYLN